METDPILPRWTADSEMVETWLTQAPKCTTVLMSPRAVCLDRTLAEINCTLRLTHFGHPLCDWNVVAYSAGVKKLQALFFDSGLCNLTFHLKRTARFAGNIARVRGKTENDGGMWINSRNTGD